MAKNIFLHDTAFPLPYASRGGRGGSKYPTRSNPDAHAKFISRKLQESRAQDLTQRQVAAIRYKEGLYLEFSSATQYDLAIKQLENLQKGIRLLNVKKEDNIVRATVYIPAGQETYFLERVQAYEMPVGDKENRKNNDLVRSIEDVRLAILDSFWFGDVATMPNETPLWCEIWLRFERNDSYGAELDFTACCNTLAIELNPRRILFPERIVRLGKANKEQLKNLISMCAYIAEIRRAPNATSFFDNLSGKEQVEWVDELLTRTTFHNMNASVCLLDTGLSAEHPLLSPATREEDVQTVESAWRIGDHDGHGSEMAGVALFNDLKGCLSDSKDVHVLHKLESVKILPPRGENPPELYGAVTEQAVALAEIASPYTERAICMAVTSPKYGTIDGSPTSWSGAVDSITSGAEGSGRKRLFFISAGNVDPTELSAAGYPGANILHCVENPGQAWNALTVGAYTKDITIEDEEFSGFSPVADVGDLSPYSSTSVNWDDKWPIKPEILLDGGNIASNGTDYTNCPDLSLLTTDRLPLVRLFSTIWGTSSATAQAAWMAAQLFTEYPDIWPETVRALLVHSSRWTDKMYRRFCTNKLKSQGIRNLLRSCGYGIPHLEKAIQCLNNSVNMIIQGEIQPYEKSEGSAHTREMHLHTIPWPAEVLQSLGETEVELRVTLSYFIEPGPGEIGWKNRYRYPSHGLRFDLINANESVEGFKKRINVKMRGDDPKDKGDGSSGSSRWFLGPENRDVGSIHSDFIKTSAVNLCNANVIAVYPVIGWWRERSYLGKCDGMARYSLVVSLSTPREDVDLYTAIIDKIPNYVQTEIPTT